MSLLTNQYIDVPTHDPGPRQYEPSKPGKLSKRRFFQSGARWDETVEQLLGREGLEPIPKTIDLGTLMEMGGQTGESVAEENMEEDSEE